MRAALFSFLFALLPLAASARDELPDVAVLADSALTVPLTRLAGNYTRQAHVSVTLTFAPSFEQTLAIEEGEQADLFITANPESLKSLQQQGLYDISSKTPLIESRLSLVSSYPDNEMVMNLTPEKLKDLRARPGFLLATANATASSEGYFAAQILQNVPPKLFLVANLVQLQDTEDVLDFMKTTPSYGVLFESDAMQRPNITALAPFPKEWHDPAVFNSVVVAGGRMDTARSFVNYLKSAEAQRVFIKYGFYPTTAVSG